MVMLVDVTRGALRVLLGRVFGSGDVARLRDALSGGAFSNVTLDFSNVCACHDGALALLARELSLVSAGEVALTGLAEDHWRVLTELGVEAETPPLSLTA